MTTYNDLTNLLVGYSNANKLYKQIEHFPAAREEAAKFALEEKNDQTAARTLSNPDTPIEKVAEALGISSQRKYQKLEDLVENKFAEILKDDKIKRDRLEGVLMNYLPKEDVPKQYKELAEAHKVKRNILLYENKEKADPDQVKAVLGVMEKDVIEHYESKYKAKRGDSKEDREQKEIIRNFFISLYVRDGKPIRDGEGLATKYLEINEDKLRNFNEELKTKPALIKYIENTIPEDKETRINFLGRLVG